MYFLVEVQASHLCSNRRGIFWTTSGTHTSTSKGSLLPKSPIWNNYFCGTRFPSCTSTTSCDSSPLASRRNISSLLTFRMWTEWRDLPKLDNGGIMSEFVPGKRFATAFACYCSITFCSLRASSFYVRLSFRFSRLPTFVLYLYCFTI